MPTNSITIVDEEQHLSVVNIDPRPKSQDRYVFRNLKNYVVRQCKAFAYAAVKCFRTYTNFKAFTPNASRKVKNFLRFWKENYKPLVFISRIGEFLTDFISWTRRKHRFFAFYIFSAIFLAILAILFGLYDPYYLDAAGIQAHASFMQKMGTPFWISLSVIAVAFIHCAYGLNNLYKKMINLTRKYPITVALVMSVIFVGIPLLCTVGQKDFWKAITTPAIICLVALVYFYLDFSIGLLSRFLFRKSDDGSNVWANNIKGYLYLAPALVPLLVFTFYPMINAILMGFVIFNKNFIFTDWSLGNFLSRLFTDPSFIANNITLKWYSMTLVDPKFYHSLISTVAIVIVTVPISTGISVVLAVMMNSIKKFQGLYQTIYFLPYVTAMTAVTSVWRLILDENGVLNTMFGSAVAWLNNPDPLVYIGSSTFTGIKTGAEFFRFSDWAYPLYVQLFGFMIYSIWDGLAFKIVIFLTGLQSIDKQVYQAAQLDGASKIRTFFKITLKLLAPIMLFITTTSMIGAFKTYTSTKSLFLNDPKFNTIVFYMFQYIDGTKTDYDRASAIAGILFVIIMSFTGIRLLLKNRKNSKDEPVKAKKVKGQHKVRRAERILQGGNNN